MPSVGTSVGMPTSRDCSLYISIPFCPSRCSYCSFVSYTSGKLLSLIPDYLEALCLDVKSILAKVNDACAQFGASCEISNPRVTCGVNIAPDSALLKAVEAALAKKGHTMLPESTFGGCDASNLSAHGIAALNVSCGMDRVHSTEERIAVADLEATADFVESILAK